jgi:hypothetical protein
LSSFMPESPLGPPAAKLRIPRRLGTTASADRIVFGRARTLHAGGRPDGQRVVGYFDSKPIQKVDTAF